MVSVLYTKASPDWDTWKRSDDAACLRKLWTYGSSLCKTEMEDMTGGGSEKIRMTHAAAAELERKAIKNGMVPPGSDTERPSLWTLQKLANNHGLSGKHVHLEWESYVSMEQEEKSSSTGKGLKTKPAVFLVGGKQENHWLGDVEGSPEPQGEVLRHAGAGRAFPAESPSLARQTR